MIPYRRITAPAVACLLLATGAAAQERLTLDEAIALALRRNERAAIADTQVEAAEARVRRARAFFFPELNLSGTYTRRAYETTRRIGDEDVTIQSFNAFNSAATLNATLFDARAFPLYRQARLSRESIAADAANDKRLIAFEAADAFIATLSLEQVLQATGRRRDLARANLDDARARFEAGLVSSNDVTRAELEVATAEREVIIASGNVELAYLELGNLLDTDVPRPLAAPVDFLTEAADAVQSYSVDRAREERLDLLAARRSAAALREFALEPSRRWIPTLGLTVRGTNTNEGGLSGRENDGFAAVTMNWPVFDGGERSAERAERVAQARAAELDARSLERRIELEFEQALVEINSDQASLRQAATAVEVARKNAEETMELYRQGLASALEVTDANFRLFEAEVAEARARYQLALAYLNLRAASGKGPTGEENRS